MLESHVYLTEYSGLLCQSCALDTSKLVDSGVRWLDRLTVLPARDVWARACCEECKQPFTAKATA